MTQAQEIARRRIADTHNPWIGLAIVLSAIFMTVMDGFITIVAAPSIRADLQASVSDTQLILAVYNLAFGAVLVAGGRIGDLYGRRRVFFLGLALFTLTSLGASLAISANMLIAMRLAQGMAAGLMMPQVFSIIQVEFQGEERGKALGAFALVAGLGATVAQIAGGALLALDLFDLGWRTIFLINIPIGGIALVATLAFVRESKAPRSERQALDLVGIGLLMLAIISLTAPLTIGAEWNWPTWSMALLAIFPVLCASFVVWQRSRARRGLSPLVEPSLLRNRTFAIGNVLALLFYTNNAAFFLAFAVLVQDGLQKTALTSGLLFAPLALTFSVTAMWVGRFVAQHGIRLIVVGSFLLLSGYALTGAAVRFGDLGETILFLVPGATLVGIGMGFIPTTINFVSLQRVEPHEVGSASGVLNTSFELGYGLGTVFVGLIFLEAFRLSSSSTTQMSPALFQDAFLYALGFTTVLIITILGLSHPLRTRHASSHAEERP